MNYCRTFERVQCIVILYGSNSALVARLYNPRLRNTPTNATSARQTCAGRQSCDHQWIIRQFRTAVMFIFLYYVIRIV